MTRDEAIEKVLATPLGPRACTDTSARLWAGRIVDRYVALGMLKLDTPLTQRQKFAKELAILGFAIHAQAAVLDAYDAVQS